MQCPRHEALNVVGVEPGGCLGSRRAFQASIPASVVLCPVFMDSEAVMLGQEVPASRGQIVRGPLGQAQTSLTEGGPAPLGCWEVGVAPSGGSEGDRPCGGGIPETCVDTKV